MKFSLDFWREVCKTKHLVVSDFRDARVVKDMATGKSKGYGFVSFFNKWVSAKKKKMHAQHFRGYNAHFVLIQIWVYLVWGSYLAVFRLTSNCTRVSPGSVHSL